MLVFARRRRWRCGEALCAVSTWSEHVGAIAARASSWLAERGVDWCSKITLATLDPAAGYRKALDTHLPNAVRVVDHFHAIKLANIAIDDARRRVQQVTLGHRGRKGDPLYRGRRVFLTAYERLSDDRLAWMFELLAAGDTHGEVGAAILAKELLREVYSAVDAAHARRRMIVFLQHCAEADTVELTRLARTIDRWMPEILAYHSTSGASNGRVENIHMLAEKTRKTLTDSSITSTIAAGSSADSASNGLPSQLAESEAVNHTQSRRAPIAVPQRVWTDPLVDPGSLGQPSNDPG